MGGPTQDGKRQESSSRAQLVPSKEFGGARPAIPVYFLAGSRRPLVAFVLDRDHQVYQNQCDHRFNWISHSKGKCFLVPKGTEFRQEEPGRGVWRSTCGKFRVLWSSVQFLCDRFGHVTKLG